MDMSDLDRRAALSIAGLGLAASTALLLPACARQAESGGEDKTGAEKEVTAAEDLMREHGVLRRILILYREAAPLIAADPAKVDAASLGQAAALFRDFGERYHEQMLEEQNIFPRVRKAGGEAAGLVDTLLAQHARGREINDFVTSATRGGRIGTGAAVALSRALAAFSRMYEAHAAREDTIVFPAFKAALGEKEYDELGEQFEEIEKKTFGGDGFDIALAKVARIETALGMSDLAGFTAPPLA
jgi:hemerythrin-like domain-containing protein